VKRVLTALSLLCLIPSGMAAADTLLIPGGASISLKRKSIVDLRFVNVTRQQFDLSCGAAAVATLLENFYNDKVDEKTIISEIVKFGDKEKIEKDGFSMLELKRFGDRRGYVVQGFKITKPDAVTEVKIPFLTLVNSRGYNHFVIVKGVRDGVVYIADPAFGNRSRTMEEFKAEWSQIILVYLSKDRKAKNQFAFETGPKAPTAAVVQLLDRTLTLIRPSGNQF